MELRIDEGFKYDMPVKEMANRVFNYIQLFCLDNYCLHNFRLYADSYGDNDDVVFTIFLLTDISEERIARIVVTNDVFSHGINSLGVTFDAFCYYIALNYLCKLNLISYTQFRSYAKDYHFEQYEANV